MATKACIFCGHAPLTSEHLFPGWMETVLAKHPKAGGQPIKWNHHMGHYEKGLETTRRAWSARGPDIKTRCVCKTCNETWMGTIETAVKPHLTSMITSGNPFTLTPEIQALIATWAALKATVAKTIGHQPLVAEHWRRWMFEHHTAPPEWHVWLGSYSGYVSTFYEVLDNSNPLAPVDQPTHGVVFDMLLGYLQVKVLGVDRTNRQPPGEVSLHIWPERPTPVTWPPKAHFSDASVAWWWQLWKPLKTGLLESYPGVIKSLP